MKTKLFLASQSSSRHKLLSKTGLPFAVLKQHADESVCDETLPLEQLVQAIATYKMDQLRDVPQGVEDYWVITADTLCCDAQGVIHGKPADTADAIAMLRAQGGSWSRVATAFCVTHNGVRRECQTVISEVWFDVPESSMEGYLSESGAMQAAGAMVIDGPGARFVREIRGSYSNIVGLPLFELMQVLERLDYPGL